MKIYITCTVRKATEDYKKNLEEYVAKLENDGHEVHLPHRDTKQDGRGIEICKQNRAAIEWADEIHIFYNPESQGSHFDLGIAFAFRKPIKVIENVEYVQGKSFARMIAEWQNEGA